jgi:hypothetical protein
MHFVVVGVDDDGATLPFFARPDATSPLVLIGSN